jgi:hypothetical protein
VGPRGGQLRGRRHSDRLPARGGVNRPVTLQRRRLAAARDVAPRRCSGSCCRRPGGDWRVCRSPRATKPPRPRPEWAATSTRSRTRAVRGAHPARRRARHGTPGATVSVLVGAFREAARREPTSSCSRKDWRTRWTARRNRPERWNAAWPRPPPPRLHRAVLG